MPTYVYLSAFGLVASLFCFRWALPNGGTRTSAAARRNLGMATAPSMTGVTRRPSRATRIVDRSRIFGSTNALQRRLAAAGLRWNTADVQMFRLVSIAGPILLGVLLAIANSSGITLLVFAGGGLLVSLLPDYVIRLKSEERQQQIELQLPDILDKLRITMEAGLGFDSALANVVDGRRGPAYEEFNRVLQDLQFGVARDEALLAMSERTTVTDLRVVLAAVLQSARYGLPLVEVLRVQSEELRDKRWQRAQEQALKVPVKILFPLILCIMPPFFVVLLGPNIIRLMQTL